MFRSFVLAIASASISVGFAASDTFVAQVTKVDANRVTYKKGDQSVTTEAIPNAVVTIGHFDKATGGKINEGTKTPLKDGLVGTFFKNLKRRKKAATAQIHIADEGPNRCKITAINVRISAAPK